MNKQTLLKMAVSAAKKAYCPYSKFRVGAALLASNGKVFTGCNVENASYGLTICAERAAFAAAIAASVRKFKAIAIVASGKKIPYPCGACRQVMSEFCNRDFAVYCAPIRNLKKSEELRLGTLLPKGFKL
jgi:cytidine deaminase